MFSIARSTILRSRVFLIPRKAPVHNYLASMRFFSDKTPKQDSKYKEAFEDLKTKIHDKQPAADDKFVPRDTFDQVKDDLYRDYKYGHDPIDAAKKAEADAAKKVNKEYAYNENLNKPNEPKDKTTQQTENKADQAQANTTNQTTTTDQASQTPKADAAGNTEAKPEEEAKPTLKDRIVGKAPFIGKVADFVADSWEQTFPSDKYQVKAEQARKLAKEKAEKEKNMKEYTEEELEGIQGEIPEWKRTAMTTYEQELEEKSMRDKLKEKLKEKFNETDVAKKLYQTDQYKEYEDFKKEMSQFREDLKDHMSQSQNPAVIASMAVYTKATSESNTAMAIKEMRKYIKDFDVFDLERDAKGIFCDVFNHYLKGELTYIEKTCEDAALAYFKTMLKKREVEGVYPKYTEIWESEPAEFVGGRISERGFPCFTYSVRLQEIHCYISKKTNQIVDGAEDRLLQNRYNFVLSLHESPDLEVVGHPWVIIEVIPVEAVHMLA